MSFAIAPDELRDLLVIRYGGRVDAGETERCLEEIQAALARLQPGFQILADLTDIESMDISCASGLRKIMDLCNEKGVAVVVRVIPDARGDIGLQIMSYFHYRGDVRIVTCESIEEANKILSTGRPAISRS